MIDRILVPDLRDVPGVPDPDRAVLGAGVDLAVGDSQAVDAALVAGVDAHQLSGLRVEGAELAVGASSEHYER